MEWFKHKVGMRYDNAFVPYYNKWKSEGIDVFWAVYELMADNFSISTPGECFLNWETVVLLCRMRQEKIKKILVDCGKIPDNKGIYCQFETSGIFCKCPYLKELADEYTRKKLFKLQQKEGVPKDNVRTMSGQTPTLEERRGEKSRVDKNRLEKSRVDKIIFNYTSGQFDNITKEQIKSWQESYPGIAIEAEIKKAKEWCKANPDKKKKNWHRFLVNWFSYNKGESKNGSRNEIDKGIIKGDSGRFKRYEEKHGVK